jgi:hypothetical protein
MGYLRRISFIGLAAALTAFSQTPCTLTVTPQNILVVTGGGSGNVTVTVSDPSCAWAAAGSNSPWIQQTSMTGAATGNGAVSFTVAANTNPTPRTGTLTLALLGATTVDYQVQILETGTITAQAFNDVPLSHPYVNYVNLIRNAGITTGCSLFPPLFCPEENVTRGQMAAFIVRAALGSDTFTYPDLPYFDDVNQNHPFFKYIQKLREMQITAGCSATPALYCPDSSVTRQQMAVFLMRGKFGATTANTNLANSTTPYFGDVASAAPEFPFIQKLKDFGITSGCTAAQFCPGDPVSRGQTSVFLSRLFLTPYAIF